MPDSCCLPCLGGLCCGGILGLLGGSGEVKHKGHTGDDAFKARLEKKAEASARVSDLGWLNDIAEDAWPRVESFLQDLVRDQIEPMVDGKLPGPMKGAVQFVNVKLGRSAPDLGPILVSKIPAKNGRAGFLQMQIGIDFTSELQIELTALRIPIGMKHVSFRGLLTVELSEGLPLTNKPPFFGSVVMYFINAPEIELDFTGLANVADMPMLQHIIRGTIKKVLGKVMVIPARIAVDMDKDDDVANLDLKYPDPIGVLQIVVKSAYDLKAADTAFFSKNRTSDPYVVIEVGRSSWTSSVMKATTSPTWPEGTVAYLPVYSKEQRMNFEIYDDDRFSADDLLGQALNVDISTWLQPGETPRTLELKLEGDAAGTLCLETTWLVLPPYRSAKPGPLLYLAAKVGGVTGVAPTFTPPFKIHLSYGAHSVETNGSHPEAGSAPLAKAMHKVCCGLAQRNMSAEVIAEITDLDPERVNYIVAAGGDSVKAQKIAKEATAKRAATTPRFEEVIHLLLPVDENIETESAMLEIKDKGGKSVAPPLQVPFARVLPRSDTSGRRTWGGEMVGPFHLHKTQAGLGWERPGASFVGNPEPGMQIEATIVARWLHSC